jgi:dienelactone hydrolase
MEKVYIEEFVTAQTEDGLRLDGALVQPAARGPKPLAIVWVSGLNGRFTGNIALGRIMASYGYASLAMGSRGEGFGSVFGRDDRDKSAGARVPWRMGGGGWERFSESPRDIAAWIDVARTLGFGRVVVAGRSLGALKVGYYQAERQDPRVAGVAAISPPGRASILDPHYVALAERMVAEGRGLDLLPWGAHTAGVTTMSAQAFLDRARTNLDIYGFHPDQTPEPRVATIRCPIFASFGTLNDVGGEAELDRIRRNAVASPRLETHIVEGANHGYAGKLPELASLVAWWAESLS